MAWLWVVFSALLTTSANLCSGCWFWYSSAALVSSWSYLRSYSSTEARSICNHDGTASSCFLASSSKSSLSLASPPGYLKTWIAKCSLSIQFSSAGALGCCSCTYLNSGSEFFGLNSEVKFSYADKLLDRERTIKLVFTILSWLWLFATFSFN